MAKFFGAIGYTTTVQVAPGVWQEQIVERNYTGDIVRNTRRWENEGEKLNDDLNISNVFSIVADPFAYQNFHAIRYVKWMGALWKINNVEVLRPRLRLTAGGVYNEQKTSTTPEYFAGNS